MTIGLTNEFRRPPMQWREFIAIVAIIAVLIWAYIGMLNEIPR